MLNLIKPAFEMIFILRKAFLQLRNILPLDKLGADAGNWFYRRFSWSFLLITLFVQSWLELDLCRLISFKYGALAGVSWEKVLLHHELNLYWLRLRPFNRLRLRWWMVCSNSSFTHLVRLRLYSLLVFCVVPDTNPSLTGLTCNLRCPGLFSSILRVWVWFTGVDIFWLSSWGKW